MVRARARIEDKSPRGQRPQLPHSWRCYLTCAAATVRGGDAVSQPAQLLPPSGEQVNDRHEKGGTDDGPQHREGMPTDGDHERLRELEQPSDPRPKKGPDEAKRYRGNQPAANVTRDGLPDGAAKSRDHDEQQERRY